MGSDQLRRPPRNSTSIDKLSRPPIANPSSPASTTKGGVVPCGTVPTLL